MFTSSTHSSGDLCGGVIRSLVWWRFGQAKDDTTPEEEAEVWGSRGHDENSFFFEIILLCRFVWRFGVKEAEAVRVNFFFFFLKALCFFKWWAWHGKHLLAGVKPMFYTKPDLMFSHHRFIASLSYRTGLEH